MDKKRTQRILGILVIIALVIILFPLLFGRSEAPTQTTSVQAPPFPDQQETSTSTVAAASSPTTDSNAAVIVESSATPVGTDSNSVSSKESDAEASNSATSTATKINDSENASDVSPAIAMDLNNNPQANANMINANQPKDKSASVVTVVNNSEQENQANESVIPAVSDHPIKSVSINKTKKVVSKSNSTPLAHKDLVKLNSPAWAVQMGSFKDKENARNLADRLRAAGYNAFIKEVKSSKGSVRSRVYIGPEFKQANALKISAQVQQEMNLQGIVVSYKPLAL